MTRTMMQPTTLCCAVAVVTASIMVLPGTANAFFLGNWMSQLQRETKEQKSDVPQFEIAATSDPEYCSNHLTLHGQDDDAWMNYEEHQEHFMTGEYAEELAPGSLITTEELLFTPVLSNADLIFWGLTEGGGSIGRGQLKMSFFNATIELHGSRSWPHPHSHDWEFTHYHVEDVIGQINRTKVLDGDENDYVVLLPLLSDCTWDDHLMNHIGYLAYLRQVLPSNTKLVLGEASAAHYQLRIQLEALDHEFAKRFVWIECGDLSRCNQRLQIRGEGTMKLLRPESSPKHTDLMRLAREWIASKKDEHLSHYDHGDETSKMVIYFKPNNPYHYPTLNVNQEDDMIEIIHAALLDQHRDEQLVVFHQNNLEQMTLVDQMALFHSASLVIGPHDVASSLLWTNMGTSCTTRPKFLEITPDSSVYANSMHRQYSTLPWMECHMIMMKYAVEEQSFHLDLKVVAAALSEILDPSNRVGSDHRDA
jgi:hypothetical protein